MWWWWAGGLRPFLVGLERGWKALSHRYDGVGNYHRLNFVIILLGYHNCHSISLYFNHYSVKFIFVCLDWRKMIQQLTVRWNSKTISSKSTFVMKRWLSGPLLWLGEMKNLLSVGELPNYGQPCRGRVATFISHYWLYLVWLLFLYSFNAPFVIICIFVLLPILDIMLKIYTVRISFPFLCKLGLVFQRSAKYEGPVTGWH